MRLNLSKLFKFKNQHEPDMSLIWALLVLILFGLVILFNASSVYSYNSFGTPYHYIKSQLFPLGIGIIAFFVASLIDYHVWKRWAFLFLVISIILLILVFIPGIAWEGGPARSWIKVFGQTFQPAELVKLTFLIYLATWLEAKKNELKSLTSGFIPFLFIVLLIGFLMMMQPDFGTFFIILVSAFIVFFVSGGRMKHIIFLGILAGIGLFFMINHISDYQLDRFRCVFDPQFSPQNECYQINQSLIAVGSGGFLGRGLGQSRQKYMYLPEAWGDSIFAIMAEEVGFLFSTLLVLLYLFIFYRGFLIARHAPDLYGTALATGIISWLAVQTFLNIGGMINLIPMTGVPLPFISHGGSSLLAGLIAMGILVNISKQTKGTYHRL
jgi:cell division protein FtsW